VILRAARETSVPASTVHRTTARGEDKTAGTMDALQHVADDQLLLAWRGGVFILVVSEHILTEVAHTLKEEPYFRDHLDENARKQNLALLRTEAVIVHPTVTVQGIATHPEDDLALSAAVSAQADYLVTGDKKLHRLGMYRGTRLISPRAFLDEVVRELDEVTAA